MEDRRPKMGDGRQGDRWNAKDREKGRLGDKETGRLDTVRLETVRQVIGNRRKETGRQEHIDTGIRWQQETGDRETGRQAEGRQKTRRQEKREREMGDWEMGDQDMRDREIGKWEMGDRETWR